MALDPAELGDGELSDGIRARAVRGREADVTIWGIDGEAEMLDALEDHVYGDLVEVELGGLVEHEGEAEV